jgi:hypothetical protein
VIQFRKELMILLGLTAERRWPLLEKEVTGKFILSNFVALVKP